VTAGPYLGPETGDVLDVRQLAELEGLRAARAVTDPFPVYEGTRAGEREAVAGDWFTPASLRRAAREH
jgi:hypothetical protein